MPWSRCTALVTVVVARGRPQPCAFQHVLWLTLSSRCSSPDWLDGQLGMTSRGKIPERLAAIQSEMEEQGLL